MNQFAGSAALVALVFLLSTNIGISSPPQTPVGPPVPFTRNRVCTLLGGVNGERAQGVWPLSNGNFLIAGETSSSDFATRFGLPTPAPFDTTWNGGDFDAYVAILNPTMSAVVAWTYFGGTDQDRAYFAIEDNAARIWVCGFTESASLPSALLGGNIGPMGGFDVFVARFSSDLHDLEACIRIGGTGSDNSRGTLWVDDVEEAVYVSGGTTSTDFPTTIASGADASTGATYGHCPSGNSQCPNCSTGLNRDAFVFKSDRDTGTLMWSRVFGGNGDDNAWANVRVSPASGDLYVGGATQSQFATFVDSAYDVINAPTSGARNGPQDGFVAMVDKDDARILALAYLGGSGTDSVAFNDCLELDGQGRPVVCGITRSPDLVLAGQPLNSSHSIATPDDCDFVSNDIFVAKLSADLSALVYSSYVNALPGGGCGTADKREEPAGLALYGGYIFLTGETDSPCFPVTDSAFDGTISASHTENTSCPPPASCIAPTDIHDAFLIKLSPAVSQGSVSTLQYGTFFGGNSASPLHEEPGTRGRSLTVFSSGPYTGMALFSGQTTTSDFDALTTPGVVQATWPTSDTRSGFVAIHVVY